MKRPTMLSRPFQRKPYQVGQVVRVIGLACGKELTGEVIQAKPVRAKVVENDPVWHGTEVGAEKIKRVKK